MHIQCIGLNHHTAEVCLRERLAFTEEKAKAAMARLGCGFASQPDTVSEMVILSTCNRVEVYAVSSTSDYTGLERFISEIQAVAVDEFSSHLYHFTDESAVEHLFRVASGLDSLVLGEPQILGQVMNAFELARSQGASGAVLSKLFQAALHTGKRARTETAIGHSPASISSVAIHLAEKKVHDLKNANVCVMGAGEMAELAVEALRKRGVTSIQVVNRTLERARLLAQRWGGEAATFENLEEVLIRADILITSTGAPHTLVHTEHILPILPERVRQPLVIIDIAVPRDVDIEVGQLPGVYLFDIDMLHEHLEHSLAQRAQEVPRVESILNEEKASFMSFFQTLDVMPLIAEMRQRAESIRQAELEKTLRRMGELTPQERQRLEAMTEALVKKILHTPITRLREEAGTPKAAQYAAAARSLFGLDGASAYQNMEFPNGD